MLMMRLQRIGRKNNPSYRILVVDKRASTKSNNFIDHLGHYEPKSGTIVINAEKAKEWMSKGAQPSDTLYNMMVSKKIIEGKKRNVLPRKSPIVNEAKLKAEAEAKAKAEADAAAALASAEAPKEEVVATEEVATVA